ncbi:MAG: hypothetical protein WD397_14045 [Wenzhouxiangellaceae bacterium]
MASRHAITTVQKSGTIFQCAFECKSIKGAAGGGPRKDCMFGVTGLSPSRQRQILASLLLSALFFLLSACAAVDTLDTQPFQDYQSAISSLKDSSDQALQGVYQEELDQFKGTIGAGESSKVPQLLLDFPPDSNFAWSYPASGGNGSNGKPLFASIAEMRQTMAAMNTQLLNYAGLLLVLAGADDSTEFNASAEAEKFDNAAGELVHRLTSLDVDTGNVDSGDLALFSTIAANLADAYLEDKRVELLGEILNEGMGPLQTFVDMAQRAMVLTAKNAQTQYQNTSPDLARAVVEGSSGSALDDLLSLNNQIVKQLTLYRNIYNGYGALPNSQRQLIAAVKQSRDVSLGELINYIANIKQQYENLNNRSSGEPAGD